MLNTMSKIRHQVELNKSYLSNRFDLNRFVLEIFRIILSNKCFEMVMDSLRLTYNQNKKPT